MSTYAIGDLQGCREPLQRLLDEVSFDPAADQLWFVGDLVNRGPDSLGALKLVRSLGPSAITVLGNHDLHLLAVAAGTQKHKKRDTLKPILQAPDSEELLHWLRHRPLLHRDDRLRRILVHAGLAPAWTLDQACALANELEQTLRDDTRYRDWLAVMYGDQPARWDDALHGWDRLRAVTNHLTRMRYCLPDGTQNFNAKGPPGSQPAGLLPWFELPHRRPEGWGVVFGHWSTLGVHASGQITALDSGCVWGGPLTAIRLEDQRLFSVPCTAAQAVSAFV